MPDNDTTDKTEQAGERTREAQSFMRSVRRSTRRRYTPEEKDRFTHVRPLKYCLDPQELDAGAVELVGPLQCLVNCGHRRRVLDGRQHSVPVAYDVHTPAVGRGDACGAAG